jgi:two-component system, chemotaxis family, chemotaxis protein CheY
LSSESIAASQLEKGPDTERHKSARLRYFAREAAYTGSRKVSPSHLLTQLKENSVSDPPPLRWPFPIDHAEPLLVVDDQKTMVELTRRVLSRMGFENIDDAADGYQALTLLREKKHKVVISDLRMAAMGGIQFLKAIRADDQLKNTPFILMTGSLEVPNVLAARYAGTDAYLLKPFTQDQLKAKLLEVLSKVGKLEPGNEFA